MAHPLTEMDLLCVQRTAQLYLQVVEGAAVQMILLGADVLHLHVQRGKKICGVGVLNGGVHGTDLLTIHIEHDGAKTVFVHMIDQTEHMGLR